MTELERDYFEWLVDLVCAEMPERKRSYNRLLLYLYSRSFYWLIPLDENRAMDGLNLRNRFGNDISTNCSVLEMMVALAVRCEEALMFDPDKGDRTGQWFWEMIINLGLNSQTDENFREEYVRKKIDIFLDRNYMSDGRGGLFTVPDCVYDLRRVEIWMQLGWYIDYILDKGE